MGQPKLKTPKVPPPMAIPEVGVETEEEAMKRVRRRSGYEKTLTMGNLAPKQTGKLPRLG